MSLPDLLLSDRIILISAIIAALPMLVALGLIVQSILYRTLTRVAEERKQRMDEHTLAGEEYVELAEEQPLPQETEQVVVSKISAPTDEPEGADDEAEPTDALAPDETIVVDQQSQIKTVTVTDDANEENEENEDTADADEAPGAIQDILFDVFEDEEANARYEALLDGVEPIEAEELVEISIQVADNLRALRQAASGAAEIET